MIDEDGVLKFNIDAAQDGSSPGSPDFENPQGAGTPPNNTYNVVVTAADAATGGQTGYHKITVMVTNVDEPGKVTWTVDPDGTGTLTADAVNGGNPITQFQVGAVLTVPATDGVTDGDVSGADKNVTERLQWYRSPSKDAMGTAIATQTNPAYTVTTDDIGMYIRVDVFYNVGTGREESASRTSDYPVLASRSSNDMPEFSPATVSREVSEGDMGMTVGAPVTATDDITNALNYTIGTNVQVGGSDVFKIDQMTGQITTAIDLDYDTATDPDQTSGFADVAGNGVGDNKYLIGVVATDSAGSASTAATVTISLKNVDEKPTFVTDGTGPPAADSPMTIGSPENRVALFGTETGTDFAATAVDVTYAAVDPEGLRVNRSLMGADADKFQLSTAGVLSFRTAPDYEDPTDANEDNVYEVTVRASDGVMYADRMVRVTVARVDDAPEISGPSSVSFDENDTDPVATLSAMDPEGVTTITWSIPTGDPDDAGDLTADDNADSADFMIDQDGMLKFNIDAAEDGASPGSPDYENPQGGTPASNTYNVVVAAADAETGGQTGYHKVTVKVNNVAETGKVTWTTAADGSTADDPTLVQFQVGSLLTATASDGDISGNAKAVGTTQNLTWQWFRGSTRITDSDANDNTYTVTTDDVGSRIRASAFYTVGTGREESASLISDHPVLDTRTSNDAPEFGTGITREVSEGEKGMNVGAPVTATDDRTNALNYVLSAGGADNAKFEIDQKTGQITTMVDLNREQTTDADPLFGCGANYECVVTVTATDSAGNTSDAATVTITLTNVDEKPTFSTGYTTVRIAENTTVVDENADGDDDPATPTDSDAVYAVTDTDGLDVTLTLMGADGDKFSLSSANVLSFRMAPDYENPADANGDNVYEVTVRASDGTMYADRMVEVTVTDANEAPVISAGLSVSGPETATHAENSMEAVGAYMAAGPGSDMAMWSVSGDDMDAFSISADGMLMFASPPDFEMPTDMGMDNEYNVMVVATSGDAMDSVAVMVTVTNEQEDGMVSVMPDSPLAGDMLTATLSDEDGGVVNEMWTWETSADGMTWAAAAGTATGDGTDTSTYTTVDADANMYVRAMVSYNDMLDDEQMAMSGNVMVRPATPVTMYDRNSDGVIEINELLDAIEAHYEGDLTVDELLDVIEAYFETSE